METSGFFSDICAKVLFLMRHLHDKPRMLNCLFDVTGKQKFIRTFSQNAKKVKLSIKVLFLEIQKVRCFESKVLILRYRYMPLHSCTPFVERDS